MTLLCIETKEIIEFGDGFYVVTRSDLPTYVAVSPGIIESIPFEERSEFPVSTGYGFDIHIGTAGGPTSSGGYEFNSLSGGPFQFSVSRETAERYLPRTCEDYPLLD